MTLTVSDALDYARSLPSDMGSENLRKVLVVNELCSNLPIMQRIKIADIAQATYYKIINSPDFGNAAVQLVKGTLRNKVQEVARAFLRNATEGGPSGNGIPSCQIRYLEEVKAFRSQGMQINIGGDLIVQGAKEIEANRQTAWQRIAPAIEADFEVVDDVDSPKDAVTGLSGAPIVPDMPKRQAKPLTDDQMVRLRRRRMRNARAKRGVEHDM